MTKLRVPEGTHGAVKRSLRIAGHATSISLEPAFWDALCEIAERRGLSVAALVTEIDRERNTNLSSAIRVFVLESALRGEIASRDAAGSGFHKGGHEGGHEGDL